MEDSMKKARERFMDEFRQASSAEKWSKECVELMKNLLKCVYYIDVTDAMENGGEYPGSEYMDGSGASYARGGQRRNAMGQYSRTGSYDRYDNRMNNGSGMYPMSGRYYRDDGMSGRRYYDDEMGNAIHMLERMKNTETNPDKRMAIQEIMDELHMR